MQFIAIPASDILLEFTLKIGLPSVAIPQWPWMALGIDAENNSVTGNKENDDINKN